MPLAFAEPSLVCTALQLFTQLWKDCTIAAIILLAELFSFAPVRVGKLIKINCETSIWRKCYVTFLAGSCKTLCASSLMLCRNIFQEAACLRKHKYLVRMMLNTKRRFWHPLARLFVCPVLWSAEDRGELPSITYVDCYIVLPDSIGISIFINSPPSIIIIVL